MALSRQGSLFGISEDSITRALGGDTSPQAVAVAELTPDEDETLAAGNEEAITSPYSTLDPKTFDQWSTQQRRQEGAEEAGFAIVNQGVTNQETAEDRERRKDDAANDALGEMVEQSQQSLKREREELQRQREQQFADFMRNDYGINMTSGQWKRAEEVMSDDSKRKKHFDDLQKKNGWTDKERDAAEKSAMEIIRLKQLYEQGKISEAELKKRMGDLKAENPTAFNNGITAVNAVPRDDGLDASSEIKAESAKSGIKQTDDVHVARIEQKAEVKALPSASPPPHEGVSFGRTQFPNAPNATADFDAVRNPQPMQAEQANVVQPKPMQTASVEPKFGAVTL